MASSLFSCTATAVMVLRHGGRPYFGTMHDAASQDHMRGVARCAGLAGGFARARIRGLAPAGIRP